MNLPEVLLELLPFTESIGAALKGGDIDTAERQARVLAETLAAKRAVHEAYLAGQKAADTK